MSARTSMPAAPAAQILGVRTRPLHARSQPRLWKTARGVLRRAALRVKAALGLAAAPAALGFGVWLVSEGRLRGLLAFEPAPSLVSRMLPVLGLVLLLGTLAWKGAARLRGAQRDPPRWLSTAAATTLDELEAGAALVLCTFATLQALGGARSPLHPLVYALAAFLCSLSRLGTALPLLGLIVACEALLLHADGLLTREPGRLLVHGLFIGLFGVLHALFLQGQVLLLRRDHDLAVGGEIRRLREEASQFRLLGGGARDRAAAEVVLAQGSVVEIKKSLAGLLGLLRHALGLHACALYFVSPEQPDTLVKKEAALEKGAATLAERVPIGAGALGMVAKRLAPLNLADPKDGHLAYYPRPPRLRGFVGVPVLDSSGALWAILAADRVDEPLRDDEEALLCGAAEQVLRVLQSERAFAAVERSRYEHERLYHASERMNRALTPEQVHEMAFQAANEVVAVDFAALTSFDREARTHTVVAAAGALAQKDMAGRSFADNAGLCAMALKNRAALPAAESAPREALVFDEDLRLPKIGSLLVLPLLCAGEPIGTLVFAAERAGALGREQRGLLGVVANQVAVSLENARMYEAMKAMATTDGLTGLTNRRCFNERFEEMLRRAERQGKCLTLLMTDIDHFKKVNDTYGHPVGDQVLKRVAQVAKSCLRKIDVAARYGGEEFALVLELTDREGARQLAERVRLEVARQVFPSDKGPFQCTLSLGLATFPQDGTTATELVSHADQALYHAKHNGRNRAVSFDDLRATVALPRKSA